MEFAEEGDLLKKVEMLKKTKGSIPESEIWTIIGHLVNGLKVLHDLKILHRDLKCANVFIFKNNIYKLGDLNVSKIAKQGLVHTQTGTPYYASPEVWKDKPYDSKSDIWSLGAVIYELCALQPPFMAKDIQSLSRKVISGIFPPIPKTYSDNLSNLVKLLLQVEPSKRPNADQILSNVNVAKELSETFKDVDNALASGQMIKTIKMPRNIKALAANLPKPNYQPPSYLKKQKSENKVERNKTAEGSDRHSKGRLETIEEEKKDSKQLGLNNQEMGQNINNKNIRPLQIDNSKNRNNQYNQNQNQYQIKDAPLNVEKRYKYQPPLSAGRDDKKPPLYDIKQKQPGYEYKAPIIVTHDAKREKAGPTENQNKMNVGIKMYNQNYHNMQKVESDSQKLKLKQNISVDKIKEVPRYQNNNPHQNNNMNPLVKNPIPRPASNVENNYQNYLIRKPIVSNQAQLPVKPIIAPPKVNVRPSWWG